MYTTVGRRREHSQSFLCERDNIAPKRHIWSDRTRSTITSFHQFYKIIVIKQMDSPVKPWTGSNVEDLKKTWKRSMGHAIYNRNKRTKRHWENFYFCGQLLFFFLILLAESLSFLSSLWNNNLVCFLIFLYFLFKTIERYVRCGLNLSHKQST